MANFIMGIISMSVGVVVLSGVFITTVKNTNQSYTCVNATYNGTTTYVTCAWTASEIALYGLLTIVGIAGLVYGVLNVFGLT